MNTEVMYEAITGISDHYIEEADPEAGSGFMPRVRRLRPVWNMAAVLVVVLGLSALALNSGLLSGAKSDAPAADAAVAEYSLQTEAAYDVGADESAEAEIEAETAAADEPAAMMEEAFDVPMEATEMLKDSMEDVESDFLERAEETASDEPAEAFDLAYALDQGCPLTVTWNGVTYTAQAEYLLENVECGLAFGVLDTAEGAEFQADSEAAVGWNVFVSVDGNELYLEFENGWLVYRIEE